MANMKGCKLLLLVTIYCSCLWWSCACDSISDIPIGSKNAINGPNTATIPQEIENVNIELNEVTDGETSSKEKIIVHNLEIQNQVTENTDENLPRFSETLHKTTKEHKKIVRKKLKQGESAVPATNPNIAKEIDTKESGKVEDDISSEQIIQSSIHSESQDKSETAQTMDINNLATAPSPEIEVAGNVSPISSPEPVEVITKENISPSSVADNVEAPEHPPHPHSEAMPSFDEWKKMMLTEQEKGGHEMPMPGPPGKKIAGQKRRRNYASYECGAKIVASNAEAEGTSRILNGLVDEYMLNPCQAKIWFVIELCESVQASQIELANFELFSSCPKDFAVYASDNFPTRDWIPLGIFSAAEQRVLQSFPLKQEGYGKFIKIELQSHYGKEHYCPLSVVRIFGTSMVDEYEEMETLSSHAMLQDDELDRLDLPVEDKSPTNIFGSATDAVFNIVKKAAQVLVPHQATEGDSTDTIDQNVSESEHCKLLDNECNEKNKSTKEKLSEESPNKFLVSATSIHRTLFNHLRRCEQCIKTSQPSYHSVSEPQCRFFQVALGPVLFTSICDWFREHHLPIITNHVPTVDVSGNMSATIFKPTSPPPSVIHVIIDRNQSESRSLPTSGDKKTTHKSESFMQETSELPTDLKSTDRSTTSTGVKIDSEIKPTKTLSTAEDKSHVDISGTINTDNSFILKSEIEDSLTVKGYPVNGDIQVPGPSPVNTFLDANDILTPSLTTVPSVETSVATNETKVVAQSFDRIDDDVITSTMELTTEDFTEEIKTGDDKFTDVRDSTVKLETVVVGGTTGQKESVFVRMNNRIKALELNMSLSSQYLQELSQRYRRQMEEMQRAFNRTIGTLNDTAKKAAERDVKQQEVIGYLQSQVANLTLIVDELITERSIVLRRTIEIHIFLMVVQAIVMITIMSLCVRRVSSTLPGRPQSSEQNAAPLTGCKRRSSTDSSPTSTVPKIKKRSSSEEVLSPGNELLIVEPAVIVPLPKVRKRNRKKKNIQRSLSNPSMSPTKSSTSPVKKKNKEDSSPAGIIFSSADAKKLPKETGKSNYACENCNKGSAPPDCGKKGYVNTKENRKNYLPLKNLTNGDLECLHNRTILPTVGVSKEKEKFSFKKFLKFQKRESI